MIELLILSVLVGVGVGLICVALIGPLIKLLPGPLGSVVGDFFSSYGWVIGILVGLWYFFSKGHLF